MFKIKRFFVLALCSFLFIGLNAGGRCCKKVPIIYHPSYNISLAGLQKLHPFDTCKYKKVYNYLRKNLNLRPKQFYKPSMISDESLLLVHTQEYLESLRRPSNILKIAELSVPIVDFFSNLTPYFLWNHFLLKPMRYATGGTVLGAELASDYGYAINLSGGYHHAKADKGEGFCYFADIPLAVHTFHEKHPGASIMIVDLDAHQGNGHEEILKDNSLVHIFDVYNGGIYPNDIAAREGIEFDFPIESGMSDDKYLKLLRIELPKAINKVKPDFIIYNAGTDIFDEDRLGDLSISSKGIIERDEFVFTQAIKKKIPILMVLSGGYTSKSAEIIGESIVNLFDVLELNSFNVG